MSLVLQSRAVTKGHCHERALSPKGTEGSKIWRPGDLKYRWVERLAGPSKDLSDPLVTIIKTLKTRPETFNALRILWTPALLLVARQQQDLA